MSAISEKFAELEASNEAALVAYITVGDPSLKQTARFASALIQGGVDIIELGIPFSDPIADGPVIQAAVKRSLASGTKPLDALKIARAIDEKHDIPVVLMTYYNPIFRVGLDRFFRSARESGVSGIIVPDLPVEESGAYKSASVRASLDTIFLASPSTEPQRLREIISHTSGYLYLISLYGVTGVRQTIPNSSLDMIRKYSAMIDGKIPLAVGFGISEPKHVRSLISAGANGAIVGSAFVKIIEDNVRNASKASAKLTRLARSLKKGTLRS